MKKSVEIILISVVSVAVLIGVGVIGVSHIIEAGFEEGKECEGKTITVSDAEKLDDYLMIDSDLKSSITKCEAYYTPTTVFAGYVQCYFSSGHLTVTEEYYNKLLAEYDDWEVVSAVPQIDTGEYSEEEILERADNDFKAFVLSEEFLFSEKMFNSEGRLYLLSKDKNEIYFFINRI